MFQLLDALVNKLTFNINVEQCLKKLLNGLLDLSFYWATIISLFSFLQDKFPVSDLIIAYEQIRSLGDQAASLSKKEKRI